MHSEIVKTIEAFVPNLPRYGKANNMRSGGRKERNKSTEIKPMLKSKLSLKRMYHKVNEWRVIATLLS